MSKAKQKQYKSAYSPTFEVYVAIDNAHKDDHGCWIYTCHSNYSDTKLNDHLFRACELTGFSL